MAEAWRDTRHAATRCPFCDHRLDTAGNPEGATPSPGDVSVCISCASPLLYEEGLRLRAMTSAEFNNLDVEIKANVRRYQQIIRRMDRTGMGDA